MSMQPAYYFEDLEPGVTVETARRTITETDIVLFTGLSGDFNPLHTDALFAAQTQFGERIAHGLLVLAVATGLANQLGFLQGTAEAFTGLEWKYRAPVKAGDTIRARIAVLKKRALPGYSGGLVTFDVEILNQRDETAQKGTWTVMVRGKETTS